MKNQATMIGPKTLPIFAVPRLWIAKSPTRIAHVIGMTAGLS